MDNPQDIKPATGAARHLPATVFCLVLVVFVFLLLRLPGVGHLLTWNEASAICAAKALVSASYSYFLDDFWRHPPLLPAVLLQLQPMTKGLAGRAEILMLVVSCLSMLVLYRLNTVIFGRLTALWSVVVLAVMPGSILFDVSIVGVNLMTLFGLLALLAIVSGRFFCAGLCLGIAFLADGTAILFMIPAVILACCLPPGRKSAIRMLLLILIPVLICQGWLFLASSSGEGSPAATGNLYSYIRSQLAPQTTWLRTCRYFVRELLLAVGPAGAVFGLAGFILCLIPGKTGSNPRNVGPWWPVILLLSFGLLTLLRCRNPWLAPGLMPALATISAIAIAWLNRVVSQRVSEIDPEPRAAILRSYLVTLLILVCLGAQLIGCKHESLLCSIDKGQWSNASNSRLAARLVGELIGPNDRILLGSFSYWKQTPPGKPCPVFASYCRVMHRVAVCSHEAAFEEILNLILCNRYDWIVLAPPQGRKGRDMIEGFVQDLQLKSFGADRISIFHTTDVYSSPNTDKMAEPPVPTLPQS